MSEQNGIVYTLSELPAPVDKQLDFDKDGKAFRIVITDQILIPVQDYYELNVYGTFCQVISRIRKNGKEVRTESKIYEKDDVLKHWEEEVNKIVNLDFDSQKHYDSASGNAKKVKL